MRLRPSARVAALLASFAVLLALGAVYPPLVTAALVLDAGVALAWLADVILGGRLGFVAGASELVFAIDARLPRPQVALARRVARNLGAEVASLDELGALECARVVVFTDSEAAAPPDAILVLVRADTNLEQLTEKLRALA